MEKESTVSVMTELKRLIDDIRGEFGILAKQLGVVGKEALGEAMENPVRYVQESARELVRIGVYHPVLAKLGGESLPPVGVSSIDEPVEGSILYTDLFGKYAQHSGIYIGNGQIVELNREGCIQSVSRKQFTSGGTGIDIYVSCRQSGAVGSATASQRARNQIQARRQYNVLLNNCHQFVSGCLTGNFENEDNFLWMLKHSATQTLGADCWRTWR